MKLNDALRIKNEKRTSALDGADKKRAELHARFARIAEIDAVLRDLPLRTLAGESVDELRAEAEQLNEERVRLLSAAGYPDDYDTPKFECGDCNDSGYCGLKLCRCVREIMSEETYRESSLAGGLVGKTFDNFSLAYYTAENELKQMSAVLNGCKKYAESFPKDNSAGLYFHGGTGLGKTHLTAAIANIVAAKGMSVVYESAQQIFDTVDAVRFNRMELSERKKYENCALLIIDDLGAECMTQYSISAITSIIDMRIVNGKKTIISSNLNPTGLKKAYGERLYSRILGEFRVLQFTGKDIRLLKNKG